MNKIDFSEPMEDQLCMVLHCDERAVFRLPVLAKDGHTKIQLCKEHAKFVGKQPE